MRIQLDLGPKNIDVEDESVNSSYITSPEKVAFLDMLVLALEAVGIGSDDQRRYFESKEENNG